MTLSLLIGLASIVILLAITAPLHYLLLSDQLFIHFQDSWEIAGIKFDPHDLTLGGVVLALLLRGSVSPAASKRFPYLLPWLTLGLLLTVSYLHAPMNREYLTDPIRIAYQLYRYCWKTIIYFPLALLLLKDVGRVRAFFFAVVLAADFWAYEALIQGFQGARASGPFQGGNALGAALLVPIQVSLASFLSRNSLSLRIFYGLSLLFLARALLFSGSRGAFVGAACGSILVLLQLFRLPKGRIRVARMLPWLALLSLLAFLSRPDLLESSTVKRFSGVADPLEEGTMRWRMTTRWPHFWAQVMTHPVLGVGTEVDPRLGGAPTPHNAYLGIAVKNGLPAALFYLTFIVVSIRNGTRLFSRSPRTPERLIGLIASAGILSIAVHGIAETTLLQSSVRNIFWILVGIAAYALPQGEPKAQEGHPKARPPLTTSGASFQISDQGRCRPARTD